MNNNFMGYFDPMHNGLNMGPEFGRGPPGQPGGFGNMPMNMSHGGMGLPNYQHQRFMPYEPNSMMGPLSPSVPGLNPGSGIGPPPSSRMMEMNIGRLQHYRAAQQSQLQHSPASPMPGMNAMSPGLASQNPFMRMPNLAPKQQMMEPRLQSQLGNGITRWPRMPGSSSLSRPQMPQLMMQQGIHGSMPLLHNAGNFPMGNSPGFSSPEMLRFMKMEAEDTYHGGSPSISSFDFGQSHAFPPNQNPYGMDRGIQQPGPSFKQSSGNPLAMQQDSHSMSGGPNVPSQPQSLPLAATNSKTFNDNFNKFATPIPNSPKLTHYGPSPGTDIFDQPPNPLTSQQKSPFSPFGDSLNDNLNSSQSMGMHPLPQPLSVSASSPMMQPGPLNLRSPTKINPLMMQIQQLKQQIAQLEDNPLNSNIHQISFLKQQLEQTYIQYISQQRSSDFPSLKESQRQNTLQDFLLDKPPMTPSSQTDYLDKPPATPRPRQAINDFLLEKAPKNIHPIQQNDFLHDKSHGNPPPHLQQDFMMIKSPQTPAPPPQHDMLLDKPPMTPRRKSQHEMMLEKQQAQTDFIMDRAPQTPRPKLQHGFVFEKPQQRHPQQSFGMEKIPKGGDILQNPQDSFHEKQMSPHRPPDFVMEKMPLPVSHVGQSQQNFKMVKSPLQVKAPSQLLQEHHPQQNPLPLHSPPSLYSQASQSPMSTHTINQEPADADMDIKDDMSFLDELFQTKLSEQAVKSNVDMMSLPSGRKDPPRASSSMPILDGMHTSTPSSSIPPTMPVLAPSVPPMSASLTPFPPSLPTNMGMRQINQNPMPSMPPTMPMQMSMMSMNYSNPLMMMNNMQEPGHHLMMPNMYNFGQMPSVKPPSLKPPSTKEKSKASKSSTGPRGTSGFAPAAKKKKVRRKSSESDTIASSPKTPMTPATPNSTAFPSVSNLNPPSNVSSMNSGDNITAVNPFTLDDNLADNAATRRSLRERKKKNYSDDYDYNMSDDDEKKKGENPNQPSLPLVGGHKLIAYKPSDAVEGEIAIIEKILAGRIRSITKGEDGIPVEEEEFCVKYKGYSYLHCEWGTEKELSKKDKRAQIKIKRFKMKRDPVAILAELDDEPFNPDYVEVDRVLDVNTCMDQITGEPVTHYLVKWRSLPYEDSTWELKMNVDEPKIKQYLELKKPPPPEFQQYVARPQVYQWKKIERSPDYKDQNTLRDYQLEGLNWLTFCWYKRQNCILADEMGLGKTVQGISLLYELKRFGVRGPFLVIAPLSTIVHWQREFEAWTDINAIVYHGSSPSRLLIQQYEMHYKDEKGEKISGIYKFEAVITTYEMILSDNDMLSKIPWRCVVIDEAHRLKNRNCKLLEGLNNLQFEHRVLLTGTPLQNNVEELFSLLNFLEPTRFPSQAAFLLEFGDLKTEAQVEKLQQILKPMMLRRLKADVEKNVPPKEETIIEVELTTTQKRFYRAILEKNFTFLTKGLSTASNTPNLMNAMMELRKCCNHPFLITGAEERIVSEYANGAEGIEKITKHFKAMTESSGKMVLIDKLLPKLKDGGHKVLIFSQMIRVLDLLEDYLLCKKYAYERIDGRVRGTLRQAAVDRFCREDSDRFVFLLCTRAGGLGINLTAADIVIIFDSDWNPQNDLQAQARCHRIGQSKSVKIYRLICRNTYEREMFDRASRKLALDRAVLQNMSSTDTEISKEVSPDAPVDPTALSNPATPISNQPSMSKKEIEDLLKRGAYGSLMEDDSDASSKFCEEDIDQILERRTQVIKMTGEEKGSTFSKASFVSNTAKIDMDIDDPEFWTKWAQKASINVDDLNNENLIIDKPRERKQTKRFGNEDGGLELSDAESDTVEVKPTPLVPAVLPGPAPGAAPSAATTAAPEAVSDTVTDAAARTSWSRAECFRIEKNLLTYGWGRWRDFLSHDYLKSDVSESEIEAIARTILVFCLHHFKGDEKIKAFVSSLINKSITRSRIIAHEAPKDPLYVPELSDDKSALKKPSKQPKKITQQTKPVLVEVGADWKLTDPDTLIIDPSYRKHLQQNSKRILSRIRLLYSLRHEIIANVAEKIMVGTPASEVPLQVPRIDGDMMRPFWDADADKSLLIGVFKHGYDKYDAIRNDPCLCFASKLGSIALENEKLSPESHERRDDDVDPITKKRRKKRSHDDEDALSDIDDFDNLPKFDKEDDMESMSLFESPVSSASPSINSDAPRLLQSKWPQPSELNTRLRRLIAGYAKYWEKEQLKMAQAEKDKERKEKQAQQVREKQLKKAEMASRWTRREVTDFYRAATTFGVVYDEETKKYDWSKFRKLAKLDKKDDDRITAYFEEFTAMCRRVTGKSTPEDIETKKGENLEPISDERANRVLHRVKLLQTIRNKVLPHENFDERLLLCEQPTDFPFWWKPGVCDKELLLGVSRHGLARTDFFLFADENLKFKEILENLAKEMKMRREAGKAMEGHKESGGGASTSSLQTQNSTAPDSETTSLDDTPSAGINADRQPVATNNDKEEKEQRDPIDRGGPPNSTSREIDEIIASWPKDKAILSRLEKVCHCVMNNAWPRTNRLDMTIGRSHGLTSAMQPLALPGILDRSELMRQPADSVGGQEGPRGERAEGVAADKNFKVTNLDGLKITVKKKRRRRTKEQMAAAQLAQVPPPEHLGFPVNHLEQLQGMQFPPLDKMKKQRRKRKGEMMDSAMAHPDNLLTSGEPPLKIVPHPVQLASSKEAYDPDVQMKLNPPTSLHGPGKTDQRPNRVSSSLPTSSMPVSSPMHSTGFPYHHKKELPNAVPSSGTTESTHQQKPLAHSIHSITCTASSASRTFQSAMHLKNTSPTNMIHQGSKHNVAYSMMNSIHNQKPTANLSAGKGNASTSPVGLPAASKGAAGSQCSNTYKNQFLDQRATVCPNANPFEKNGVSNKSIFESEAKMFDALPKQLCSSPKTDVKSSDRNMFTSRSKINSAQSVTSSGQIPVSDQYFPMADRYFEGHKASAAIAALAAKLHSQAASKSTSSSGSVMQTESLMPHVDHKMSNRVGTQCIAKHSQEMPVSSSIGKGVGRNQDSGTSAVVYSQEQKHSKENALYNQMNSFKSASQREHLPTCSQTSVIVGQHAKASSAASVSNHERQPSIENDLHHLGSDSEPPLLSSAKLKVVQSTPIQVSAKVKDCFSDVKEKNPQIEAHMMTATVATSMPAQSSLSAKAVSSSIPQTNLSVSKMPPASQVSASYSQLSRNKTTKNVKTNVTKSVIKRSSPFTVSPSVTSLSTSAAPLVKGKVAVGKQQPKSVSPISSAVSRSLSSASTVASAMASNIVSNAAGDTCSRQNSPALISATRPSIKAHQAQTNAKSETYKMTSSAPTTASGSATTRIASTFTPTLVSSSLPSVKKPCVSSPASVSVITPLSGLMKVVDAAKHKGVISLSMQPGLKDSTKITNARAVNTPTSKTPTSSKPKVSHIAQCSNNMPKTLSKTSYATANISAAVSKTTAKAVSNPERSIRTSAVVCAAPLVVSTLNQVSSTERITTNKSFPSSSTKSVSAPSSKSIPSSTVKSISNQSMKSITSSSKTTPSLGTKSTSSAATKPVSIPSTKPISNPSSKSIVNPSSKSIPSSSAKSISSPSTKLISTPSTKSVSTPSTKSISSSPSRSTLSSTAQSIPCSSTKSNPASSTKTISSTSAKPSSTSLTKPISTSSAKPMSTSSPKLISSSSTKPISSSSTKPISTSSAKPMSTSSTKPISSSSTKPISSSSALLMHSYSSSNMSAQISHTKREESPKSLTNTPNVSRKSSPITVVTSVCSVQVKQPLSKTSSKPSTMHRHSPRVANPVTTSSDVAEDDGKNSSNAPVASRTRPSTRRNTSLAGLNPGLLKKSAVKSGSVPCSKVSTSSTADSKTQKSTLGPAAGVGITCSSTNSTSATITIVSDKGKALSVPASSVTQCAVIISDSSHITQKKIIDRGNSNTPVTSKVTLKESNSKNEPLSMETSLTKKPPVSQTPPIANASSGSFTDAISQFNESIVIQTTRTVTNSVDRPKIQKKSLASIVNVLRSKSTAQQSLMQTDEKTCAQTNDEPVKNTDSNITETTNASDKDLT